MVRELIDLMITASQGLHFTGVDLSTLHYSEGRKIVRACVQTLETCQFDEGEDLFE